MIKLFLLSGILFLIGCTGQQTPSADMLPEADARLIALEQAGLDTATFTKQEYDADDADYEFEFHTDTQEYECEVDARNGNIKDYSVEQFYSNR